VRWSLGIGRIAGIRVELHITFVLFVLWIAFSQTYQLRDLTRALSSVVFLLLVFGCVLLHELGHALAARRYGIRTRDIVLLPIGGIARLERMPEKPQQELVVAIAGPLVNVAIVIVLYAIGVVVHVAPGPLTIQGGLMAGLFAVNVVMVLFNLIPAYPMDGGRVLRAILAMRLPYVRATRVASIVGQAIAVAFAIAGVFWNPMLVFIALFVFLAAGEEYAMVQARSSLSGLPVRAAMLREFEMLQAREPLQRAVDLLMDGTQQEFPVLDGDRPVGLLTRADLLRGLQQHGPGAPVEAAMSSHGDVADPMEPLEDAFRRMRERGLTAMPVVQAGRLVGFVTLENVSELLLVQDALRRHAGSA
jgi:Zn-dependent protease/predicted transcriptional regulator